MPVSCLPGARDVLVWEKAEVDVFSGEFELVHENVLVALVDCNLLISVYSDQSEANLFNIDIMDSGMGKDVVCV